MTTPFHTKPTHRPAERPSRLTELPDPPQSPDMATQFPDISRAHTILDEHYAVLGNVVAMGASYLCWETSETQRGAPYPDLIVALDMPLPSDEVVRSNRYTISEIGKPPDCALEVASKSTGRQDYTVKRGTYAAYSVAAYWRFDPTGGSSTMRRWPGIGCGLTEAMNPCR